MHLNAVYTNERGQFVNTSVNVMFMNLEMPLFLGLLRSFMQEQIKVIQAIRLLELSLLLKALNL